jgi:putative Holliday junction resolvase
MRVLGVDFGRRRIGLALSDHTGSLASPWLTLPAAGTPDASAADLARLLEEKRRDDRDDLGELSGIVVGLPRRLNGEDTSETAGVRVFANALVKELGVPVHLQDERLTSREAEQRLAVREKDWRRRKEKLDAAAAAIILQDFLDARRAAGDLDAAAELPDE